MSNFDNSSSLNYNNFKKEIDAAIHQFAVPDYYQNAQKEIQREKQILTEIQREKDEVEKMYKKYINTFTGNNKGRKERKDRKGQHEKSENVETSSCPKGHCLVFTSPTGLIDTNPAYKNGYFCHKCGDTFRNHGAYHCKPCQYDLCVKCHQENNKKGEEEVKRAMLNENENEFENMKITQMFLGHYLQ